MYISLLKELYDQANRLTNSYMEGEFESKTAEQLSNSNINVVTTVNTTGLNIRLPTSGNEFFILGGVTSGGAPEIVVNPMNIFIVPAVTSIQFIQQVE